MENLRIGEERAKALDDMLALCNNKEEIYHYKEEDKHKYEDLCVTADILSRKHYIKIIAEQGNELIIMILNDGKTFMLNDSFTAQIETEKHRRALEKRKRAMDEAQYQLTVRQIKAAKREPS